MRHTWGPLSDFMSLDYKKLRGVGKVIILRSKRNFKGPVRKLRQ